MNVLVSIIIPTYKRPAELRLAALSALAQTYTNIEVLIIADGPDPAARAAVADLDPRLRYLELPHNQGPAAARNLGVMQSRGTWLTFLDDDDTMLPTKVAEQLAIADEAQPHVMIACRVIYNTPHSQTVFPARAIGHHEDVADYILLRPGLRGRPGVLPLEALLVHRSIFTHVPFTTHKDHEDWAWLLEAWHLAGARVRFVWQPLVVYNIDTDGLSRSRRANWQDSLAWVREYRKWISPRAYASFLSTKVALKAKRADDPTALRTVQQEMRSTKPTWLEWTFFLAIKLFPNTLLQSAWKRSLSPGKGTA